MTETNHEHYMRLAIKEAEIARESGEVPGAPGGHDPRIPALDDPDDPRSQATSA